MLQNILWERHRYRRLLIVPSLFFFLLLSLLTGCGVSDPKFSSEYQAVFLDNGQLFFGKLGNAGSSYLTLRDVFYIQQQVDPGKKEARNILVKRGSEWHGPDFMRINTRHVVLIEPVAPDSQVAQLIREAKKPAAATSKEEQKATEGK